MQCNEEESSELANLDARYTRSMGKQTERIMQVYDAANSTEEGVAQIVSDFSAHSTRYVAASKQGGIRGRNKYFANLHLLVDLAAKKDPA